MIAVGRLVGALALTTGLGMVPATMASADPGGEPPTIASGVVRVGPLPVPGADVIVRLWPDFETLSKLDASDAVPFHTVAVEQTDVLGRYSVSLDPSTVPEEFTDGPRRIVDVEVITAVGDSQSRWNYSVRLGSDATPVQFNLADDRTARITRDVQQLLGETAARGYDCDTHPGQIHYNRPEQFMWVKGTIGAPVRVTQTINNEHTLGIGMTYGSTSGGWTEMGSETETFSASASKGGLKGPYDVWGAVNYRDYNNMCAPTYRRPYGYYDLISKVKRADVPLPLPYCTIKRRGYTAMTGNARNITFTKGVDLGPIRVMANAGYDHGVDQVITFHARRLLCWNHPEGWPKSSKIGAWIPWGQR